MKKGGSAEMQFREEIYHRCCKGQGGIIVEKGGREESGEERSTQGNAEGKFFPTVISLECKKGCIS